jgi:multiple sugar transport system permease protein
MANISEARPLAGGRTTEQRRLNPKTLQSILSHAVLIILSLVFLTPFLWLLTTSLKPEAEIFAFPPVWIPHPVIFSHYVTGLQFIPFLTQLKNTLIYCGLSVVGAILSSSLVAYSLARIPWRGRNVLLLIIIGTMIVPGQVTMIPLFLVFKNLNWIDSLKPLIVPHFFGVPFFIFLLRQFFMTIPRELDEAARIDGASEWQIYSRVLLPLAKPVLATVGLFTFLNTWNDFLGPLVYLSSPESYTLSLGLSQFRGEHSSLWGPMMAVTTVMTVPVIIAFFFAQRTFIQGITLTGIKG